jgi:hypothetical protein
MLLEMGTVTGNGSAISSTGKLRVLGLTYPYYGMSLVCLLGPLKCFKLFKVDTTSRVTAENFSATV